MTIQVILDRKGHDALTVRPTATVKSAADQMREHNIAALVVQSGTAIVGVISERDIVEAVSRVGEHALSLSVKEILSRTIITISPRDSVKHAMTLMTRHRARHLPVIENGQLAGIISIGDVIKHRLEDLEMESNVMRDLYVAARA